MNVDSHLMAYARLAHRDALRSHLTDPNISMIDIGLRRRDRQLLDEVCIRFHVHEKHSPIVLQSASERGQTRPVPRRIRVGGVEFGTDVVERNYHPELWNMGNSVQLPPRNDNAKRTTPLCGGISISDPYHTTYGTLGGLVADRTTGELMILSNWHVLVVESSARAGQYIYQPGRMDGGVFADSVARLTRHAMDLNIDAAVATLLPSGRPLINHQLGLGPVKGLGKAQFGMRVVKSGATTQVTHGIVTGVEGVSPPIRYGPMNPFRRIIAHVVTIEGQDDDGPVSAGGDSGSLWLDEATSQAVGLHFAGQLNPDCALAIDMNVVLNALDVDIVTTLPPATAASSAATIVRRAPAAPLSVVAQQEELVLR